MLPNSIAAAIPKSKNNTKIVIVTPQAADEPTL
jgi:hypothetical protein